MKKNDCDNDIWILKIFFKQFLFRINGEEKEK